MITIVLLSCSTGWCQSNFKYSSTGELANDSVLIAYDDLRKVNTKLIELKYTKEINDSLKSIVKNQDVIIKDYKVVNNNLQKELTKSNKKSKYLSYGIVVSLLIAIGTILVK